MPLIGRRPAPMDADHAAEVAQGRVHVALDDDGGVAGYVSLRLAGDRAELDSVAVLPRAQGRGLGRALIARAEALARRAGCARITLYTNEAMHANLALYPRLGWQETGRRIEDGFRRVYFAKALSPDPSPPR